MTLTINSNATNKNRINNICDKCNYPMYGIEELGFLGNPDKENFECSPFTELMTLCPKCTPQEYLINK